MINIEIGAISKEKRYDTLIHARKTVKAIMLLN